MHIHMCTITQVYTLAYHVANGNTLEIQIIHIATV